MNHRSAVPVLVSIMGTMELAVVGLAGSGVGTALGVPMVWPGHQRSADVRLMGGWLLAVSAVAALISARLIGLLPAAPAVGHAINMLGLCAYPWLILYVHEHTRGPWSARRAWWLWTPVAAYAVVWAVRAAAGGTTTVPFVWLLPVLLTFTVACAVMVFRRTEPRRESVVPVEAIVSFLVLLNLSQIVRMLFGHVPLVPALVPLVVTVGFVALVSQVVWRSVAPPVARNAYEKSGLTHETGQTLLARVHAALDNDRLFANPHLTLAMLATAAGASPHQVSEVLNRFAGMTFHDLLQRRRVEDVKAQLALPSANGFTIEGIGATAGFGSRSALYSAFRRIEGVTPAEYRSDHRVQTEHVAFGIGREHDKAVVPD